MGEFVIKMPDVGEGVAEAELVEWHVKPGDPVREDMVLAAVMTDKATVEIPSPVNGTVLWLGAEIGDTVAVKAPLLRIAVAGEGESGGESENESVTEEARQPLPSPQRGEGARRADEGHAANAKSGRDPGVTLRPSRHPALDPGRRRGCATAPLTNKI